MSVFSTGGMVYASSDSDVGLFISPDRGETWFNKTTADGIASNSITYITASDGKIYLATACGLSVGKFKQKARSLRVEE